MATELARMKQLLGTTADYAASDVILLAGEIGLEILISGLISGKVGDGSSTYSALPYTIGASAGVDLTTDQSISGTKTFTDAIFIENQDNAAESGQLFTADFLTNSTTVLDSKEINSNVWLQARDGTGTPFTLQLAFDGNLYWGDTAIADDTGLAGVTWGGWDAAAVPVTGEGFSVSKPATGQYDVVFTKSAVTALFHSMIATPAGTASSAITATVQITALNAATVWVYDNANGIAIDSAMFFTRNFTVNLPPTIANAAQQNGL